MLEIYEFHHISATRVKSKWNHGKRQNLRLSWKVREFAWYLCSACT